MNDVEDLIRDTLRHQADRASGEGEVLAALHRPRRATRVPWAVGLATVTAAVVVVAVVEGVRSGGVDTAGPGTSASAAATTVPETPLGFTPSFLPEGFKEVKREVTPTSVNRVWRDRQYYVVSLTVVTVDAAHPKPADGVFPDVEGPAEVFGLDAGHYGKLIVTGPDGEAERVRVRDSIHPVADTFRFPVAVEGAEKATLELEDDHPSLDVWFPEEHAFRRLWLGPRANTGQWARDTTARGGPAKVGYPDGTISAQVGDDPNRQLTIMTTRPASDARLVELIEGLVVDPNPDLAWLGS
ncbi:hypothetical protein [Actinosynnema sp. NPDC020468]|uniref:hypothetical protein n=1 Tax=Actinosynnema sp. NPDC020468 TaxID=3154488 RepID=UPI0034062070